MLRCTNPDCRSCMGFHVLASGDKWEYSEDENKLVKTKSGKRTKNLEDIPSYVAKCMQCNTKDLIKHFQKAYSDPMLYFDTDNLCICGGEIWQDVEAEKDKNAIQEEFKDGDAQRKVKMKITITKRCEKCKKEFKNI